MLLGTSRTLQHLDNANNEVVRMTPYVDCGLVNMLCLLVLSKELGHIIPTYSLISTKNQ